ncbi:MAG: hypothetical protein Q7J98_08900 [Kiritimatiellia bacterium]|nr:hypothetical protein [Kiritimatiellia bacterium]
MNNEIKDDLPANWPVWTRKIVNDLQAAEDMAGKWFLDKAPDWATRIRAELIKLIFATVNVADYQKSGARFAGAVLGHHQSLLKGENGLEKQSERMTQALEWLDDELKRKLNKKAYRKMIAEGEKLAPDIEKFFEQFDKVRAHKDEAIKAGLKIASEQTVEDQTEFYEAYSRALKTEIYDEHGRPMREKMSSTTTIYFLLAVFWPVVVKKIPSVPMLRAWLCRLLGESQVGDLDRIKGICRRYGIVLTHRGRPRKKK